MKHYTPFLLLLSFFSIPILADPSLTAGLSRPNILFIIADDASRNSMSVYGSNYVKTPNFDRIANEGLLFTNAYNCNPKCAPARACLVTGRYSWQLEEATNHNPFLSDKWAFYPYLLEEDGYFVGFTGKGWGPGVYKGVHRGRDQFLTPENPAGHPFNEKTLKAPYRGIGKGDYAGNFELFLDKKPDDQPFCFWLGTKEPHRGYEKDSWKKDGRDLDDVVVQDFYPDNETIRGDLADYAIEVEWFDTHIGRALTMLEERGMLENTLVIATSDHGMPFPRIKGQIYDEGFRVPLAVRWGAKIKPGRVVTDFVTFPDVAPTIMGAVGLDPHDQMTGASFLYALLSEGEGRIDATRDHTLLGKERHDTGRVDGDVFSVGYPARALRDDRFLYVRNFKPHRWPVGNPEYGYMNTDGSPTKSYLTNLDEGHPDYRYFELSFGKRPAEELYDIVEDPHCLSNLATSAEYRDVKEAMRVRMEKGLIAQKDPRILGEGEIFDRYPNSRIDPQRKSYNNPDYNPVKDFEEWKKVQD